MEQGRLSRLSNHGVEFTPDFFLRKTKNPPKTECVLTIKEIAPTVISEAIRPFSIDLATKERDDKLTNRLIVTITTVRLP